MKPMKSNSTQIKKRFRGYLPLVIDLETGGLNAQTDAILEIAAIPIYMDKNKKLIPGPIFHEHIKAHPQTQIHKDALAVNKIKPDHPFRFAIDEYDMLTQLKQFIADVLKQHQCNKAIITGHNVTFDLNFIHAACARHDFKLNQLHTFSCLDTVTMGAMCYGETILARVVQAAGLYFNHDQAHSALYDTKMTAQLFCHIINHLDQKVSSTTQS